MSDAHKHPGDNQKYHSLPWLERLSMRVPGYTGYRSSHERRDADAAVRGAVVEKFEQAIHALEIAKRQCLDKEASSEAAALDRISDKIRHVIDRVRNASAGMEHFAKSSEFRAASADALHAIDHDLLELADEFAQLCIGAASGKDWEPKIVRHLEELERKLDARSKHHSLASG